MIGHGIKSGTRATAIACSWGDVLGPDAIFAWVSFGCHFADLALKGEKIDEDERKVPAQNANDEHGPEQSRKSSTANATESGEERHEKGWE